MDHQARQTTAVQRAPAEEPRPLYRAGTPPGARTWEVQEEIGEAVVLLGTVEAVHHPCAHVKAITQYRVFDTDRQARLRVVVRR
jgi:hypothetical protein